MNNELIEKIKAAKSAEEILEIARKELSFEDTANVAGGTGRVEMTEAQAENVVGGGHYVTCPPSDRIWIALMDTGYVYGTGDRFLDAAYVLECMACAGHRVPEMVAIANELFPEVSSGYGTSDVEKSLLTGGPLYLTDCIRSKLSGNSSAYSW